MLQLPRVHILRFRGHREDVLLDTKMQQDLWHKDQEMKVVALIIKIPFVCRYSSLLSSKLYFYSLSFYLLVENATDSTETFETLRNHENSDSEYIPGKDGDPDLSFSDSSYS